MTTLIFVLTIVACVIAFLLILAMLMGKDMNIEKTITINKPRQEVFEFLKYVKNHEHFNVWMQMDPEMKKTYSGTDGNVGFVYGWDSNKDKNVGAGEQEIKLINPGERIEYELRFIRPMQDIAKAVFMIEPIPGSQQTKVQWHFYSKMKFPMNLMMPVMKNVLSKALEQSLVNLKTYLEKI
jgi:uncharacterized protein YndB with AHSA1/START domain